MLQIVHPHARGFNTSTNTSTSTITNMEYVEQDLMEAFNSDILIVSKY